jgi:hypothetical protein
MTPRAGMPSLGVNHLLVMLTLLLRDILVIVLAIGLHLQREMQNLTIERVSKRTSTQASIVILKTTPP